MSPARSLNEFAASTLDLPALLEVLVKFAQSSLGMRAVRELAPLDPDEVSDALARVGEVQLLERAREKIGLGGVTDPDDNQVDCDFPFVFEIDREPYMEDDLTHQRVFSFCCYLKFSDFLDFRF